MPVSLVGIRLEDGVVLALCPSCLCSFIIIASWDWTVFPLVTLTLTPGTSSILWKWVGLLFLCSSGSLVIVLPYACAHWLRLLSFPPHPATYLMQSWAFMPFSKARVRLSQIHITGQQYFWNGLRYPPLRVQRRGTSPGEGQTSLPRSLCPFTSLSWSGQDSWAAKILSLSRSQP